MNKFFSAIGYSLPLLLSAVMLLAVTWYGAVTLFGAAVPITVPATPNQDFEVGTLNTLYPYEEVDIARGDHGLIECVGPTQTGAFLVRPQIFDQDGIHIYEFTGEEGDDLYDNEKNRVWDGKRYGYDQDEIEQLELNKKYYISADRNITFSCIEDFTTDTSVSCKGEDTVWNERGEILPAPGANAGRMVSHSGSLYLFASSGDVFTSDNGTTWNSAGSLPNQLNHAAAVSYKGQLWVLGGRNGTSGGATSVYTSTDGQSWSEVTSAVPFSIDFAANEYSSRAVVFNDRIWVFGTENHSGSYDTQAAGRTVASSEDGITWEPEVELPIAAPNFNPPIGYTVETFNSSIFIIGGYGESYERDVFRLVEGAGSNDWQWAHLAQHNTPNLLFQQHTSAVYNGKLWVIGGKEEGYPTSCDAYTTLNGTDWTREDNLQYSAVRGHAAPLQTSSTGVSLFFAGGISSPNESSERVFELTESGALAEQTTTTTQDGPNFIFSRAVPNVAGTGLSYTKVTGDSIETLSLSVPEHGGIMTANYGGGRIEYDAVNNYLYWTESEIAGTTTYTRIRRADADTLVPETIYETSFPNIYNNGSISILDLALAPSSNFVFWVEQTTTLPITRVIKRSDLDGGNAFTVLNAPKAFRITNDETNSRIIYAEYENNDLKFAAYDGSAPGSFSPNLATPSYMTGEHDITYQDIDAEEDTLLMDVLIVTQTDYFGNCVEGADCAWLVDYFHYEALYSAGLNGQGATDLAYNLPSQSIEIDGGHAYFTRGPNVERRTLTGYPSFNASLSHPAKDVLFESNGTFTPYPLDITILP